MYPEEFQAFEEFQSKSKSKSKNLTKTYGRLLRNRRTRKAAAAAWWKWEAAISTLVPRPDHSTPNQVESLAVIENHYFSHNAWIQPGQLLAVARRIPSSVPVIIVQGRYDLVCPATSAVAVAKAAPHAKLHLTISGHAGSDPENAKALKRALATLH